MHPPDTHLKINSGNPNEAPFISILGIWNNQLTISGGNSNARYAVMGNYLDNEGVIINTNFKRYSLRINSDHKVTDKFKIGQSLQITDQIGSAPLGASTYGLSAQDGLVWSAIRFHPGLPIKNIDGKYSSSQVSSEFGDINNPIFTVDNLDRESARIRILGSVNGDLEIVKGLHAKANIAVDANFNDSHEFRIIVLDQIRTNSRNSLTVQEEKNYSVLQEYFLSYDKQIGIHTFGIIGGYSQQTFNYSSNRQQRNVSFSM